MFSFCFHAARLATPPAGRALAQLRRPPRRALCLRANDERDCPWCLYDYFCLFPPWPLFCTSTARWEQPVALAHAPAARPTPDCCNDPPPEGAARRAVICSTFKARSVSCLSHGAARLATPPAGRALAQLRRPPRRALCLRANDERDCPWCLYDYFCLFPPWPLFCTSTARWEQPVALAHAPAARPTPDCCNDPPPEGAARRAVICSTFKARSVSCLSHGEVG